MSADRRLQWHREMRRAEVLRVLCDPATGELRAGPVHLDRYAAEHFWRDLTDANLWSRP